MYSRHTSIYIYGCESKLCMNLPQCSGRMERRGLVTGPFPDLWSLMKKYRLDTKKYIYIHVYVCCIYVMYIIYISRICMLKLLTLAAAHFHFSSARHPCCTPVQRRFALHG